MRYRRIQVIIEAITFQEFVQYGKDNGGAPLVNNMPWSFTYKGFPITHHTDECYIVPTLNGPAHFTPEDMLITGPTGEIYPCKIEIFNATYEIVED